MRCCFVESKTRSCGHESAGKAAHAGFPWELAQLLFCVPLLVSKRDVRELWRSCLWLRGGFVGIRRDRPGDKEHSLLRCVRGMDDEGDDARAQEYRLLWLVNSRLTMPHPSILIVVSLWYMGAGWCRSPQREGTSHLLPEGVSSGIRVSCFDGQTDKYVVLHSTFPCPQFVMATTPVDIVCYLLM